MFNSEICLALIEVKHRVSTLTRRAWELPALLWDTQLLGCNFCSWNCCQEAKCKLQLRCALSRC